MKIFSTAILSLFALPALAHVGPETMGLHFIEHLLIALLVGIPAGYGLLRRFRLKKCPAGK